MLESDWPPAGTRCAPGVWQMPPRLSPIRMTPGPLGFVAAAKFPANREYFRELPNELYPWRWSRILPVGRRDSHLLGQKKPLVAVENSQRLKVVKHKLLVTSDQIHSASTGDGKIRCVEPTPVAGRFAPPSCAVHLRSPWRPAVAVTVPALLHGPATTRGTERSHRPDHRMSRAEILSAPRRRRASMGCPMAGAPPSA